MTARRPPFEFCGESVQAGKRKHVEIPVARLPTGTPVSLPVEVLHGKKDGPVVWVSAAIHGDELNGVDIIWRVLRTLTPKDVRGTLLCVPVVNVFGFIEQSRYLPDRRDLNRSFPGSKRGSMASRLARLFLDEIVSRCSFGIDLHTGSNHRDNLPQVRADLDDPETREQALAFGAPIVLHSAAPPGSLRGAAAKMGVQTLLYEAGEALRFDPHAIQIGTRGVLRVLHRLGMIDVLFAVQVHDRPHPDRRRRGLPSGESRIARKAHWLRAGRSGLFEAHVDLGTPLVEGQVVGEVHDAMRHAVLPIRARGPGIVVGLARNPLVHRGEALVHVAVPDQCASDDASLSISASPS